MLRLSSDSLHISFSPSGFKLERRRGFWRPKVVDIALIRTRLAAGSQAWQPSLQSLQTAMADDRWHGLPIFITLSDRLVRYQLLPSLRELATPTERIAYASFQFHQTYGGIADQWEIEVDTSFPDSPAIACGIDQGLVSGLLSISQISKGHTRSLTPRFVATVNQGIAKLRSIEDQRYVLALFETGGITSGVVENGQWRSIRQRYTNTSPISSLCDVLDQERLASSFQHAHTTVYLINWPELTEESASKVDAQWQLKHLHLPNPIPDLGA